MIKGRKKGSNHRTHPKISSNLLLYFRLVDCPSFSWEFLRSYWIQLIGLQIRYQLGKWCRFWQEEGKILQTCLESLLRFPFAEYLIIMLLTIPLPFWRKFILVEFTSVDGVSSCSASQLWRDGGLRAFRFKQIFRYPERNPSVNMTCHYISSRSITVNEE